MSAHNDELVWEPRALWEVKRIDTSDYSLLDAPAAAGSTKVEVRFDRENFRNGTRNPIELHHMLMCPVGYTFDEYSAGYDACAAAIQKVQLFLKLPDRRGLQFVPNLTSAWPAEPVGDQSMRGGVTALDYASGMLGVTKWTFPRPMIIPRGAIAEMAIGSPLSPPVAVNASYFTAAFFEDGGLPGGNARVFTEQLRYVNPTLQPRHPFQPADGLGSFAQGVSSIYPPQQVFSRDRWRAQEVTQAGSTRVTGFSLAIDQRAMDEDIDTSIPNQRLAPLSYRTPIGEARLFGAGSGAEWWRPGIPAALLGPTLGPAMVYKLAQPITLAPGDTIDLSMRVPVGVDFEDAAIYPIYQIGVSFLGMGAIAG